MPSCHGCHTTFTALGFRSHLAQTERAECIAYGQALDGIYTHPQHSFSDDSDNENELGGEFSDSDNDKEDLVYMGDGWEETFKPQFFDVDLDFEPKAFAGDLLGDYDLDDLGQPDGGIGAQTRDDGWLAQDETSGLDGGFDFNDYDGNNGYNDDDDEMHAMVEKTWEPPHDTTTTVTAEPENINSVPTTPPATTSSPTRRVSIEDHLRQKPFVVKFTGKAGTPLTEGETQYSDGNKRYSKALGSTGTAVWHPFTSELDWLVGKWAKLRGPGSNAFNELLKIPGLVKKLDLSYKTMQELNSIIDNQLPGRPRFRREEVVVANEAFEFYYRDIIKCIRTLWGDTDLTNYLIVAPERHYTDSSRQTRLYHSMHTGKWWWSTQKAVEETHPGAIIIPLIISTDKTQLTVTKAGRRRALANLFHACMGHITEPLCKAGTSGVTVVDGKGVARRGHPILAAYVADYPEQTLVTGAKSNRCPGLCPTEPHELGKDNMDLPFKDLGTALQVLEKISEGPTIFTKACKEAGMKPIPEPFWKDLPYTNIFQSMTPDILHQLFQGIIKHLIAWLISIMGADEVDARCRCFPPNHNICLFMRGISGLSRVTGTEHQQIARFILGLVIDAPVGNAATSRKLVAAVRAILDFIYLAQYPLQTSETLSLLRQSLASFHLNKAIFVELGACKGFKLPKLHACQHFARHFENMGTADNYNTEYTERLHIDLAKNAYHSTNHRDEFPQMVAWLERREKIHRHMKYIDFLLSDSSSPPLLYGVTPGVSFERTMKLTIHPSMKALPFPRLSSTYGATYFRDALARYVVGLRNPHLTLQAQIAQARQLYIPFASVQVWHRMKWTTPDIYSSVEHGTVVVDSAHVIPARKNTRGKMVPGRFDTVLVNVAGAGDKFGVKGYCVGRLRLIIGLNKTSLSELFQPDEYELVPPHLAYIEWFTPFTPRPDSVSGLYRIARSADATAGSVDASIVPVSDIRRSIHLYPKFGPVAPPEWTSSNVLDQAPHFYVNSFSDRHTYFTIF
ncbi:hypothetical protein V5O48_007182 [Marasmius crinis-equi]|uniref:Uncharacterized protein n=1 Tax=Marasmius crinis-equi TaxID=585013 RepID=A0ABR3FHF6_9AGAR